MSAYTGAYAGGGKRRRYSTAGTAGRATTALRGRRMYAKPIVVYKGFTRKSGLYGRELKFYDKSLSATTAAGTGTVLEDAMVTVAQGAGTEQRVGRKIWCTSLELRGEIHLVSNTANTATYSGCRVRLVVVLDKQCNGSATTWGAVFADTSPNSMPNMENQDRFQILYDRTWSINHITGIVHEQGSATQYHQPGVRQNFHIKIPLKRKTISYDGATGAIGEMASNNIALMAIRDGANDATVEALWRVRYTD